MTESHTQNLREEFNRWAEAGRGEGMEQDHLPITLPVLEKMSLEPTDNVLDVGCGSGWLSRRIAEKVPQGRVVGMDVSDQMVRVARRTSGEHHNVLYVTGEVGEIPWETNFFTQAISVESAYYWPDPAAGLQEIFRVLRPGGKFWMLINYYRDNPHCHQWGALLAVKTHLLLADAELASRKWHTSEWWTLHHRRKHTQADGFAMRRNFGLLRPKARCWCMAKRRERVIARKTA